MSLNPIEQHPERNLSWIIDFGKYKGEAVRDILLLDPGYLVWAHENTDRLKLIRAVLVKAQIEAEKIEQDKEDDFYEAGGGSWEYWKD